MAAFEVGQVVYLLRANNWPVPPLQVGDRGTIVRLPCRDVMPGMHCVAWDRIGRGTLAHFSDLSATPAAPPAPPAPPPAAPVDPTDGAAICFICQQVMWPCEEVSSSWCQPVAHYVHKDCWNSQPERFKTNCQMCQQPEVGELVISAVCTLSGGRYDVHNPQDFDVASQLPPHGQDLIKLFLHQVYSGDDLTQWAAQEEERWMTGVEGAESDDSDAGDRYGIIDASDDEGSMDA